MNDKQELVDHIKFLNNTNIILAETCSLLKDRVRRQEEIITTLMAMFAEQNDSNFGISN